VSTKCGADPDFDFNHGIVVLDDPVSSLDSNALFLAFSFIRERTLGCEQLFLLTHNFEFFRQARNWFSHLRGADKRTGRMYMLECVKTPNGRSSAIIALDSLLATFESEYQYLFSRVYVESVSSDDTELERAYAFPNMARRLLEAFLAFRQPKSSGELGQKLEQLEFDSVKKMRILRFVHVQSHGDEISDPGHDFYAIGECREVLSDLIELMKSEDPRHVEGLIELVEESADPPPT
jgi:wobble nucleotide-excising tRNase